MTLVFLGTLFVLAAILCVYLAFAELPTPRVARDRIAALAVVEQKSTLTRFSDGLVDSVDSVMSRRGWRPFRAEELDLAGIRASAGQVVVTILGFAIGAFALMFVITQGVIVSLIVATLFPIGAKMFVSWKAGRRRRTFGDQLPVTLQMMASALRAGHGFSRTMDVVAREADPPMSEELARVVNESRLGRDMVESLETVAERMDSIDFSWVAGAISTQRETGGNLNEVLEQVAETIRERQHIRQQVRVLSAEGRLSAVILMLLPVLVGCYYMLVSAEQMFLFVESFTGKLLLIGSGVMYVLGGLWMRAVVKIEF